MSQKKFYITTPIYYASGDPHIGHAYTTIAADVLARYKRFTGNESWFLTGTDEHGAKIVEKAGEAGKKPKEFVDEKSAAFANLFDALNISNNDFLRTTEERHKESVGVFMQKLFDAGVIYEDTYEGLYCIGCENFITEKELVDGKCPDHKTVPQKISEQNYFFKLSEFLPEVEKRIQSGEIEVAPEKIKNEVLALLRDKALGDFSVSREGVKWGIPLPFDEKQVIYVWVEALQNYISAIDYGKDAQGFNTHWPADVQFVGKDIIKFHAIFWPAMLLAAREQPPKKIFAHGFFTINGEKMSKSLGNVIDPHELTQEYGVDATRYLVLSQFPFGSDGDIKAEKFTEQYNAELANGIGNLANRVISMTNRYLDGIVSGNSEENMRIDWEKYKNHLEKLELYEAIGLTREAVSHVNEFLEKNKPWELAKDESKKQKLEDVLYYSLESLRHIALMLYPFMPETTKKILKQLNTEDNLQKPFEEIIQWGGLKQGAQVSKAEPLFMRK